MPKYSFEDKLDEINQEIAKRRRRWQLTALAYMDFDDVSQILRSHIYTQWDKWDQSRPLLQWLNRTITNRIINISRDNYGRFAPPCNGCSFNLGDNHCSFTPSETKCAECPLYADWVKKKKAGHELKLAKSLDSEEILDQADRSGQSRFIDYDKSANTLHGLMLEKLSEGQAKIYQLLIIEGKSEDEVAKILNFKSSENGRAPGYKYLLVMKNRFHKLAKEILENNDIV